MITAKRATLILFLEGFVSSALQMTTIRQTTPFVGSSVLSTSIVISAFLAALAVGYFVGGKFHSSNYKRKLRLNLGLSILFFGFGHSYIFVSQFFDLLSHVSIAVPILHFPLVQLFLFCILIMCPLVFFLGQTVPLLLNSWSDEVRKSEAAGTATALSTVGNVFGCLICSLVLMFYFGVGYSIVFNCVVLFLCILLLQEKPIHSNYFLLAVIAIGVSSIVFTNISYEKATFSKTTSYSNIKVVTTDSGKELIINRSRSSYISNENRNGWPYIESIKDALYSTMNPGAQVLVLGAGGFTLSEGSSKGLSFTYIDVDSHLLPIAEQEFLGRPINGRFIPQDARSYLLSGPKRWDAIVIDLFSNTSMIPGHTVTTQFFNLVNSRLKNDGVLIMNVIANPLLKDPFSKTIDATIRHSFDRCVTDIAAYQDVLTNVVYFCRHLSSVDPRAVATLYTDDTTRATVDSYLLSQRSLK